VLLISGEEVAAQLGVKPRTVRTLREQGKIAFVLVAGVALYPDNAPA